jgi:single-stranded DNA-binding protein
MEVTGRIRMIGQPQDISSTFRKREVVVTTEEQYPQHILIEFTQDRVNLLDTFQIGEQVKVSINLRGREWVNPQGETRFFNTIQGWRIERYVAGQSMGQPMQNQYMQQPTGMGGQPYGENQQGGQPMQQNQFAQQNTPMGNQFPPASNYTEEEHDDLPF